MAGRFALGTPRKQTLRRRDYEARKAAVEAARWETTARGFACPGCGVLGPHSVYSIVAGVAGVECGSDWCGREFQIEWSA